DHHPHLRGQRRAEFCHRALGGQVSGAGGIRPLRPRHGGRGRGQHRALRVAAARRDPVLLGPRPGRGPGGQGDPRIGLRGPGARTRGARHRRRRERGRSRDAGRAFRRGRGRGAGARALRLPRRARPLALPRPRLCGPRRGQERRSARPDGRRRVLAARPGAGARRPGAGLRGRGPSGATPASRPRDRPASSPQGSRGELRPLRAAARRRQCALPAHPAREPGLDRGARRLWRGRIFFACGRYRPAALHARRLGARHSPVPDRGAHRPRTRAGRGRGADRPELRARLDAAPPFRGRFLARPAGARGLDRAPGLSRGFRRLHQLPHPDLPGLRADPVCAEPPVPAPSPHRRGGAGRGRGGRARRRAHAGAARADGTDRRRGGAARRDARRAWRRGHPGASPDARRLSLARPRPRGAGDRRHDPGAAAAARPRACPRAAGPRRAWRGDLWRLRRGVRHCRAAQPGAGALAKAAGSGRARRV
ncbi:MAG: hypothetical protein AVDCRST_MAG90-2038, partial [uncultured Microvirga sp.]